MKEKICSHRSKLFPVTLLHSEWPELYGNPIAHRWPKLHRGLAILSAIGFRVDLWRREANMKTAQLVPLKVYQFTLDYWIITVAGHTYCLATIFSVPLQSKGELMLIPRRHSPSMLQHLFSHSLWHL